MLVELGDLVEPYNFSILTYSSAYLSNLDYSHIPALFDLFPPSDPTICSAVAFPSLGNYNHIAVIDSIDYPSDSKEGAPFHSFTFDYSHGY